MLSLLMLTSNVSLTLAAHYCGGEVVKTTISLGQDDLDCGMANMDRPCTGPYTSSNLERKRCCENQYTQLSIDIDHTTSSIVLKTPDTRFVPQLVITFVNFYTINVETDVEYLNYSPPLYDLDIPVLIQSFLI